MIFNQATNAPFTFLDHDRSRYLVLRLNTKWGITELFHLVDFALFTSLAEVLNETGKSICKVFRSVLLLKSVAYQMLREWHFE
jgi:hypothetical protein